MPSSRRFKLLATTLIVAIITVLYLTRDSSSQNFYARTVAALDKQAASRADKSRNAKDTSKTHEPIAIPGSQKLLAKPSNQDDLAANVDAATKDEIVASRHREDTLRMNGSAEGQDVRRELAEQRMAFGSGTEYTNSAKELPINVNEVEEDVENDPNEVKRSREDHEVDSELNTILKMGPMIIFSKSYCPYSQKAKRILLEKYNIIPPPHVVELDQHYMGPLLQASLGKSTGRRTVPNVLINGKSIGGGDDVAAMDASGTLADKIRSMGGKGMMEVNVRE